MNNGTHKVFFESLRKLLNRSRDNIQSKMPEHGSNVSYDILRDTNDAVFALVDRLENLEKFVYPSDSTGRFKASDDTNNRTTFGVLEGVEIPAGSHAWFVRGENGLLGDECVGVSDPNGNNIIKGARDASEVWKDMQAKTEAAKEKEAAEGFVKVPDELFAKMEESHRNMVAIKNRWLGSRSLTDGYGFPASREDRMIFLLNGGYLEFLFK